ncbi:MAG: DUF3459 domain-containing protein [Phycisphaeraceae bacterium]|nr:MAG: DUF3459 domain-containing protein [Phycisphaeraceae bacterium]
MSGVPVPGGWADLSGEVFYQVMPVAYRAGRGSADNPHGLGDFRGLTDAVPYLAGLGVTGVWLTPIFPSPAYHGYQHGFADRVNPRLGSEADFDAFVSSAHGAGLKVILDLVVYGVSGSSGFVERARLGPKGGRWSRWLAVTDPARGEFAGYRYTTWNGGEAELVHWDLRRAGPRALIDAWTGLWASRGVDGFRLDHVWARFPHGPASADGWGYHLEPFWADWRRVLRASAPRVISIAEPARWESHGEDLLPAHDAVLAKPLQFAGRSGLASGMAWRLHAGVMRALRRVPAGRSIGSSFVASLGDHDVDRLAGVVGDARALRAAWAWLMFQPFPPMIYAGDEVGMVGEGVNVGGDANDLPRREPFKWKARAGPPMAGFDALTAAERRVPRRSCDGDGRSVEEQEGVAGSPLETLRGLIALRRSDAALRRGAYAPAPTGHPGVWACERWTADRRVLSAVNLTEQPTTVRVKPRRGMSDDAVVVELGSYGHALIERPAG